jgi:hypothetical protein
MSDFFLRYLRDERNRVDKALALANALLPPDHRDIGSLHQQARIVDDQLVRWGRDLLGEAFAD